jgi:subtilisin
MSKLNILSTNCVTIKLNHTWGIMLQYKLYLLSLALTFFAVSCSQEDDVTETKIVDECLSKSSETNGQIIEGEYIVTLPGPDPAGRSATASSVLEDNNLSAGHVVENFQGEYSYYVMRLSEREAAILKKDDRITAVEPDRKISICGCFSVIAPTTVTWNVNQVGYGDGSQKTAWIIDTGIDSDHPDLNVDKTVSKSFLAGESSYEDDNGHGTHIGGIIGALNNEIGVLGIASGARLVALKVLDEKGDGKLSSLLNALSYVKSNAKPGDVVNISIGFEEVSEILENEIRSIANRGVYFALAAGNESAEANSYSPGRTSGKNIYTVSAVDSLNRFAGFSNFGNDVIDYAAPGVRILSTFTDGRYAILSGTSMAAPHVAGLLLINNGSINAIGAAVNDPDGVADALAHK